jgi:hypothetical protein
MAETKAAAKVTSGKVVKYVGTSDIREIDANAWKSIGVEDQAKVVWNAGNKFQVPVADLSTAAVRYLDEDDSGFVVADADVTS